MTVACDKITDKAEAITFSWDNDKQISELHVNWWPTFRQLQFIPYVLLHLTKHLCDALFHMLDFPGDT